MYIFLDAITFRYRGAPAPALDGLSLFVRSGEIAAVVGPAGAGKTTLLRYVGGARTDGAAYSSVRKLTRTGGSRA